MIVAVLVAVMTTPALAEADSAWAAYEEGDFATALQVWGPAAERGDAEAQLSMGRMHLLGQGLAQSLRLAERWFVEAAEQGQLDGCAYLNVGRGKGRSGMKRLRRAAERGDVVAQYYLAVRYGNGEQAATWFRRAAEAGVATAQLKLGHMYLVGNGVPRNLEPARAWLQEAAERDLDEANFLLGELYFLHVEAPHYTEAAIYYRRAAELGHPVAQLRIGLMYQEGQIYNIHFPENEWLVA